MSDDHQSSSAKTKADVVEDTSVATVQAGTAEFKTVKAGCGIRFDPDSLDEEAGFDFSEAPALKEELSESGHSLPDNSEK